MTGSKMVCLACGKPELRRCLVAREMMFGTRENFSYLQCDNCESIQIEELPPARRQRERGSKGGLVLRRRRLVGF
jgi:NMD protein affecting ribosome stability and mRNA decay